MMTSKDACGKTKTSWRSSSSRNETTPTSFRSRRTLQETNVNADEIYRRLLSSEILRRVSDQFLRTYDSCRKILKTLLQIIILGNLS